MAFHYMNKFLKRVITSRTEYSILSKQSGKIVRKRALVLSLIQTSELILDKEIFEARAQSDSSSENKGGLEEKPGLSHLQ